MPDVLMPRLSDTMTEGVLSQWLKAEGDEVRRGDVLAEIETDKATMDLEAFESGTLTRILVQAGTTVPIGQAVAVIGEPSSPGAAPETAATTSAQPESPATAAAGEAAAEQPAERHTPPAAAAPTTAEGSAGDERVRATPLVRALAREHGIDLTAITGTGPAGRIVRVDIDAAVAAAQPAATEPSAPGGAPAPVTAADAGDVQVPLSAIRRITAERLTQSAAAPHFSLTSIVDATELLAFRAQINAQLADDGSKISVTDLLVRACAAVLRGHPEVNSSWAGDHLVRHGRVHVGLAVAIDEGLIVPVIRDADRKTVREIGAEAHELTERARAGRLAPDEFTGSTFTVSNLGMFGITEFTAVINPPEAAILSVGAATEEPVVRDGEVTTTRRMRLTLTIDHRVLDGATGAAFLRDLVRALEQPLRIVT